MHKILLASSEVIPFIKTGGLADVAGALPKCFLNSEYDVRIVLPKYVFVQEDLSKYKLDFRMEFQFEEKYVGIWMAKYDGAKYYLIDNEEYFGGHKPYGGMPNDLGRFAFFSKAVLFMLPLIKFKPDIIHCNDWQTGLIPVYLDYFRTSVPGNYYQSIKSIMTIHNLKFQGIWNIHDVMNVTGLPDKYFTYDKLEFYGMANLLKGGIAFADRITTVSKTYAKEICSHEYGEGLEAILNYRRNVLCGIVNGIDYKAYDPAKDPVIFRNYDSDTFDIYKGENKKKLQEKFGLDVDENKLLLGIVSRITEQKGIDIIAQIMKELVNENIQLIVLGTGEKRYEDMFSYYAGSYAKNIAAVMQYSETISREIYAGCDAFLMPSLFEPCGLSQLISMRYGTIPIVRRTGGLNDTVENYDESSETGTGFVFERYNSSELLGKIIEAKKIFESNKQEWNKLIKRAMEKDFSWKASANEYKQLYDDVISE